MDPIVSSNFEMDKNSQVNFKMINSREALMLHLEGFNTKESSKMERSMVMEN